MNEKRNPENGVTLADQLVMALDETKTDPVLAYAALGCAFIQLHLGLGHSKEDFINWTKEMAEITWEKKNDLDKS